MRAVAAFASSGQWVRWWQHRANGETGLAGMLTQYELEGAVLYCV